MFEKYDTIGEINNDTTVDPTGAYTYEKGYGAYDKSNAWVQGECSKLGYGVFKDVNTNPDCTFDSKKCFRCLSPRLNISYDFWFMFFMMLWISAWQVAVSQCTIAGACATWYFTPETEKGTKPAVRTGLTNCFRYHLGSLAFGSFILAVVQFVKWCRTDCNYVSPLWWREGKFRHSV